MKTPIKLGTNNTDHFTFPPNEENAGPSKLKSKALKPFPKRQIRMCSSSDSEDCEPLVFTKHLDNLNKFNVKRVKTDTSAVAKITRSDMKTPVKLSTNNTELFAYPVNKENVGPSKLKQHLLLLFCQMFALIQLII